MTPAARTPTVSLIVPCYDYGEYLPRCLGSILDQQGVDVRVLVIDDCSTDDSAAVAEALAAGDDRVEVRRHAVNHGHIATYNEGLAWADGDYVVLISADDLLTPGALARATGIMEANPQVGMVYGRPLYAPSDQPLPVPGGRWRGTTIWPGHRWIGQRAKSGYNCISSPEVVVRGSVHRAIGGYDPALPHSGDLEVWLRIAAVSDIAYVRGMPQAIYRVHPRSMLRSTFADPLVDLDHRKAAFDGFFAACRDQVPGIERQEARVGRAFARQALWRASRAVDKATPEVDVDALVAFARQVTPHPERLAQWWGLKARRALGAGRSAWFPPFVLTGAAHRVRDRVGALRWKLQGI
ncbi:MAG TPA: glycosyltransferase [Acidimicrobiales bacterium]|nr:glycosyltransferase [Acidimicrobiales bacterium]